MLCLFWFSPLLIPSCCYFLSSSSLCMGYVKSASWECTWNIWENQTKAEGGKGRKSLDGCFKRPGRERGGKRGEKKEVGVRYSELCSGELPYILNPVSRGPCYNNKKSLAALFYIHWIWHTFYREVCCDFSLSPLAQNSLEKGWVTKYLKAFLKVLPYSFHQRSPCPLASMCSKFLSLRGYTKTTV